MVMTWNVLNWRNMFVLQDYVCSQKQPLTVEILPTITSNCFDVQEGLLPTYFQFSCLYTKLMIRLIYRKTKKVFFEILKTVKGVRKVKLFNRKNKENCHIFCIHWLWYLLLNLHRSPVCASGALTIQPLEGKFKNPRSLHKRKFLRGAFLVSQKMEFPV